ncbi:hypothetical protein IV500_00815 [Paeniglutamicibacter antarcticus]|uniref:Uncharacterized protein n=1 Tax=Arthrobacter terrae TaxID=2935737 RepID=A0A931G8S0_9MICC|nr:hypothetical protein [Arthrobacter terrae]MBG0737982.1 hypothetical protein [Arthrobacter terrae]
MQRVERASEVAGVYLAWQLSADAYTHDVFTAGPGGERNWLGRVHRDVFYAGGVPVPANGQLWFELVPISVDGSRGTAAVAAAAPFPRLRQHS